MAIDIIARGMAAGSGGGGGSTPEDENYIIYGTSASSTASQIVLDSLQTKTHTGSIARKLGIIKCGSGAYIYYAFPSRLGRVKFLQYGFEGGFESGIEINYVNDKGVTEKFIVYRSSHLLNGDVEGIETIKVF